MVAQNWTDSEKDDIIKSEKGQREAIKILDVWGKPYVRKDYKG